MAYTETSDNYADFDDERWDYFEAGPGCEQEEFGCCLDDCIMPGVHFSSECHNSQMLEDYYEELKAAEARDEQMLEQMLEQMFD